MKARFFDISQRFIFSPLFIFLFVFSISRTWGQTNYTVIFGTPGTNTWTIPPGVSSITITCIGGGGAGGGAGNSTNTSGGGGGGGASVTVTNYPVSSGQQLIMFVGSGGTGVSNATGNPGAATTATYASTTFISAAGGAGGTRAASGVGGAGGAIANNIPANTGFKGGNGGNGVAGTSTTNNVSGSGGGGAGTTNAGGNANNSTTTTVGTVGSGGTTYGGAGAAGKSTSGNTGDVGNNAVATANTFGGGGGGATVWNNGSRVGGNGASGGIIITYTIPSSVTVLSWTTSGTWTVPSNVCNVWVECWGAGGGGGGVSNTINASAGGGGGGAYTLNPNVSVVPGSTISYTVGTGGFGGTNSGGAGGPGGATTFSSPISVTANGGNGGGGSSSGTTAGNGGNGGAGGTYSGGNGASGSPGLHSGGGGAVGGVAINGRPALANTGGIGYSMTASGGATYSIIGSGANGRTSLGFGATGSNPGGGGSGGMATSSVASYVGGDGGNGRIVVMYSPCPCTAPTSISAGSNSPICAGSTLNLTGTATGNTSWSWLGPNNFSSTVQNPSITNATAAASGTYFLTAQNSCGTGSGLFDDFSDNNFTSNPVWTPQPSAGSTPALTTWTAGVAHLRGADSYSDEIISTPSTQSYGSWKFDFQLVANVNANDAVRFHMISSNATLYNSSGYYIRASAVGNSSGGNGIQLYRIDNGASVSIGNASYTANTSTRTIIVTRSTNNVFRVYLDGSTTPIITTAPDGTYVNSSFAGVWTSGNNASTNHIVDNIVCSSTLVDVTVNPTISAPTFALGATSTRCPGLNTVTYTATSTGATGISYALDAASITGGVTINASTGAVSYPDTWSGTTTITATATGCGGPLTATHTVTIVPRAVRVNTGALCSGTLYNFSATDLPGSTFSWTVTPPTGLTASPTSGNASTFSTTLTNTGTTNNNNGGNPYISVIQTVNGVQCTTTFQPNVLANPVATVSSSTLNVCNTLTSGNLGGNTPPAGTGAWSIVSGPSTGSFSLSTSPSSTFTANAYGTYVLRWTVSNPPCADASATVTVNFINNTLSWGNVQFPTTGNINACQNFDVFGQVFGSGITEGAGQGAGVVAELGWSTTNSNPNTWTNWQAATFNTQVGNNDEFRSTLSGATLGTGTYYYAFRYTINGCTNYLYGGTGGVWNNNSGVLTVTSCINYGEFATAVMLETCSNNNQSNNFFRTTGSGINNISNTNFQSFNFGSYHQNSGRLKLHGAELKTWRNFGANVCEPILYYRVYPTSGGPTGAFSPINIPIFETCSGTNFSAGDPCTNGSDQKWQRPGNGNPLANVDLTTFTPGAYTLEIYYDIPGNHNGGGCPNIVVVNNNGANFTASFTIVEQVSASNTGPYCVGQTIQLNGSTLTSPSWSGPGGFSNTTQNPTRPTATEAMSGEYIFSSTLANGCSQTASTFVTVSTSALANNSGPVCVGGALNLTSSTGTSYTWSGPNSFSSSVQNPSVSASATTAMSGTYTVSIVGACGSSGGVVDNFSDGDFTANPAWTVRNGNWEVSFQALSGGSNTIGGAAASANDRITTPSTQTYGSWEFQFRLETTAYGQTSAVRFYLMSSGTDLTNTNGYYAYADGGGNLKLIRRDGSTPVDVISTTYTANTSWRTIRVTRNFNGLFTLFLNGTSVGTGTDNTYTSSSVLGIWTTGFDNADNPLIDNISNSSPATAQTIVTVNNPTTPTFTQVPAICSGATLLALPTSSTNGITGTWSPALNNTETTTYTFTPSSGQCATTAQMTITVNNNVTPTFTQVSAICSGATLSALPTTSTNGITGTWSPALNNNTTTTYTFTPNSGQCATTAQMTITVNNNVTPTFTQVPAICSGATLLALPTTSTNGITGTWSPALNNNTTTTYTFTPNSGQCATTAQMTITVNNNLTPTFTQVSAICSGATLSALPTTSTNGITGTWSPALNNTQTTTYTFTPSSGQCGTTAEMTITVNNNLTPTFTQVPAICSGATLSALPTTSTNGITGTWSPALNNTETTTYTFTPSSGQCATTAQMTITVNNNLTPTFTQVPAICSGATLSALPTTSTNGITGTWSPALNNNTTTTYTFTPSSGQCATTAQMTITVNNNLTPTFTQVPAICSGATLSALPTTSTNGITGTWSPALNNNATTTYTFTPSSGQCATTAQMTITVNNNLTPTFTQVPAICSGATLSALPTTSNNGITGTWSPALNNTETTTYTFTPSSGQCATTAQMTITVNNNVTPTFTQVPAICSGATLSALPTTSTNGITGTWSPALNNTETTTYTFTPSSGQCGTTAEMTISVNAAPSLLARTSTLCSGNAYNLSAVAGDNILSGTTYSWSFVANPNLTGTSSGINQSSFSQTLTNNSDVPQTVVYSVTPSAGGCSGAPFAITLTVKPALNGGTISTDQTICAGASAATLTSTQMPSGGNGLGLANSVLIGTQIWMNKNLEVVNYNDGTAVGTVFNTTDGAYSWYNDSYPTWGQHYGALYNWHAVNTGKLCPQGWKVPTESEWNTLITFAGGDIVAGRKLKSCRTVGFGCPTTQDPRWDGTSSAFGTDDFGFAAMPGGRVFWNSGAKNFERVRERARFWSSTQNDASNGRSFELNDNTSNILPDTKPKSDGYSVRCMGDNASTIQNSYTYQWQQDPGCTNNWTNISGANGLTYSPGILTQTTCFRRVTTDGCGTVFSNIITITVNPAPAVTNMATTICSGATFNVTPVNGTNGTVPAGTTYTWSAPVINPANAVTGGSAQATAQPSISQTLSNTTTATATATYTVTPTLGTCPGATFTVTVNVLPQLSVGTVAPITTPSTGSGQVVISQLYGGGGNSGAPYTHDFVELFNPTNCAVNLSGWSLQYTSNNGTTWTNNLNLNGSIAPKGYFLIQLASGGAVGSPLPTPDASGSINMSGTAGKVALVSSTSALTGACPTGGAIVDFVGYGSGTDCREGASSANNAPAPSNTSWLTRANGGCTDSNVNSADFSTSSSTATNPPRNSSSPTNNCNTSGNTETLCSSLPSNSITSTAATGANGTFTYQWYSQAGNVACPTGSDITGWTQIAGANSLTYAPGTVSTTTTFALFVTATGDNNCGGSWANSCRRVVVVPTPTISNMTTSICSGGSFSVTPVNGTNGVVPTGTTYSWSAPTVTGITGTTAGASATNISGTLTNTTNAPITVVYTVTPSAGTCTTSICSGSTFTLSVTVNPTPNVSNMTAVTCSGTAITVTPTNGTNGVIPTGTTFTWGAPTQTGVSGGIAGSGSSLTANLTGSGTAVYTLTPGGTCSGSNFTVTVNVEACLPFESCNVLVYTVGDGTALSGNASPVRILEYRPDGTLRQSISSLTSGSNLLTVAGSAAAHGFMNSYNGFLALPGYNVTTSTPNVNEDNNKVTNVINGNATIINRLLHPIGASFPFQGDGYRSVVPTAQNTFYLSGAASPNATRGIWYYDGSQFNNLNNTITARCVEIYNGNLYVSSNSQVFQVGTSLPTNGTQSLNGLITTYSSASIYGFSISPDGCTMYIADNGTSANRGVSKWKWNGSSWSMVGTPYSSYALSLLVDYSGTDDVIYTVTASNQINTGTVLRKLVNSNNTFSQVWEVFASSIGTNIRFSGIDFTPNSTTATISNVNNVSAQGFNVCQNGTAQTLTVANATSSNTLTYQWYSSTANDLCHVSVTPISGATSATYTPPTGTVGTTYYFAKISSNCATVTFSSIATVVVNPNPTPTISGNTPLCAGASITLTSSSASSYAWTPNGQTTQSITVNAAGTYGVTVTDANGCTGNTSVQVTNVAPATIQLITSP